MTWRIIVVDDEEDVTDLLEYHLKAQGYEVTALQDPIQVFGKVKQTLPDLILLDIMMPELNGLQICRMLRSDETLKTIPIVFLTARSETEDRIKGLETGADDYISKPFEMREVLLRVRSIFSRMANKQEEEGGMLKIGDVELDSDQHKLAVNGANVELTATEFKLLKLLMMRNGRVQSRENLLVNVWNYESNVETRTVDTHIRRLREKLGAAGKQIETIRGIGYRIIE